MMTEQEKKWNSLIKEYPTTLIYLAKKEGKMIERERPLHKIACFYDAECFAEAKVVIDDNVEEARKLLDKGLMEVKEWRGEKFVRFE